LVELGFFFNAVDHRRHIGERFNHQINRFCHSLFLHRGARTSIIVRSLSVTSSQETSRWRSSHPEHAHRPPFNLFHHPYTAIPGNLVLTNFFFAFSHLTVAGKFGYDMLKIDREVGSARAPLRHGRRRAAGPESLE
jgi:hypothetical protein